jgi:signal transduction histidine kinase
MMSLRLRLTLLYTAILTLTLFVFGVALYSIQAQDSLNAIKSELYQSSGRLAGLAMRMVSPPSDQDEPPPRPPQPRAFDEFADERAFQDLREREIARFLDAEGNLLASPFGREEDALPLSAEGLTTLQNRQDWLEEANIDGEDMLIYSRPVVQNGETVAIVQLAHSLIERNRSLQTLASTLVVAGSLTILIAFAAGWVLSALSLRPIDRITQTAQAIGDERDFTRRVAYKGPPDEVGRLASTFNQMLARLQKAYERIECSLEMQRDFVADVSHELRTPLTTLRGNIELLRRDPPAPLEVQADILTDMVEESDRLIRLVNYLLALARADTQQPMELKPVSVTELLEEVCRQARLLDPQRTIVCQPYTDETVIANADALKQILLVLLDNAVKHTPPETTVTMFTASNDECITICVQDNGPGIDAAILPHIFERFYRGDATRSGSGVGLGLSIVDELTNAQNGTIEVQSTVGKGTKFELSLRSSAAESPTTSGAG